jgi:hypothetical protein
VPIVKSWDRTNYSNLPGLLWRKKFLEFFPEYSDYVSDVWVEEQLERKREREERERELLGRALSLASNKFTEEQIKRLPEKLDYH